MSQGKSAARTFALMVLCKPAHWELEEWRWAAILMASDLIAYVEGPKPMTGGKPAAGAGIAKERKAHGE